VLEVDKNKYRELMTISEFDKNTTEFVETRVLSSRVSACSVARPRELPWLSKHLT
jgi:hypothetical protein